MRKLLVNSEGEKHNSHKNRIQIMEFVKRGSKEEEKI